LPSRGTHHEIGGNVYPKCWLCHPDEWHTSPYFPGAIRVCENCHTKDQLHSNPEHMQTNNIYTVNGVPNQTVTANEKCSACHGNGTIPMPVCTCILVPDTTEIPRGGTLEFQGTITNDTNRSGTVLFATDVTKPDENRYPVSGYLIEPLEVYLSPYQSKSGYRSHTIPLGAQLGIYTYHGYVGRYGVGKLCECQFEFEVVEQQQ
jgi:DnaJ-class molecular chaperone